MNTQGLACIIRAATPELCRSFAVTPVMASPAPVQRKVSFRLHNRQLPSFHHARAELTS